MVQNNKVLTVSYGTFSCTLEGFEESFDTMKAIAEYFRDLASDDRYFGAEPPQPDAEMLTRIAQREIDRQVEARTSDGAIHLRAAQAPVTVSPDVPIVDVPATPVADVPEQPVVETAARPLVVQAPEPAAEATVAVPIAEPKPSVAEDVVRPKAEQGGEGPQVEGIDLAAVAAAVATNKVTKTASVQDLPEAELVTDAPDTGDDTIPAADSIAAKLQRIRAVVAQAPRDDEFSEDQHADFFIKESAVDIAAAMRLEDEDQDIQDDDTQDQDQIEIAAALERIDQRGEATDTNLPAGEADTEVAVEAVIDVEPKVEVKPEVEVETAVEVEPEVEVAAKVEIEAKVEEEPETAPADDSSIFEDLEDTSDSTPAASTDEDANILAQIAKQTDVAATEPEITEAKPPVRARIVRVKRAAINRAVESGALEEISEEAPQPDPETSLSEADEADLMQELAAVEAELLATDAQPAPSEEPDAEMEVPAETRTVADTPDNDVSRLMATADEKLDDAEASSSRETYDHLRAAMAAAQADRAAGGNVGMDTQDEAYREDLASVVRPRRPTSSKTVSQRPVTAKRPAPLKLVAELRVDETPKKASGPIRPRRIASSQSDDAEFSNKGRAGGFAEYAGESGAIELHELLEAAASYMSFVEGRDHFSRPQLMNKVKQLDSSEFNREDGLRSFGQLLREGKIEKTNNGQFTASGQIGFRPGQRAVG